MTSPFTIGMPWAEATAILYEEQYKTAAAQRAPHVLLRVVVERVVENQYVAYYGLSFEQSLRGYGSTPAEACAAFDKMWMGAE